MEREELSRRKWWVNDVCKENSVVSALGSSLVRCCATSYRSSHCAPYNLERLFGAFKTLSVVLCGSLHATRFCTTFTLFTGCNYDYSRFPQGNICTF